MKKRISATIEEDIDKFLDELLKDRAYRNKSHIIEQAIELFWREKKKNGKR